MAYGVTLIMIKHLGFFRGDVCSQFLRPRPYLRASETRHKAVVSKFIVSQARPHQKTQLFFQRSPISHAQIGRCGFSRA